MISLYDIVRILALPRRSREKRALEVGPPQPARVKELFDLTTAFWTALKKAFPEMRKVCESKPSENQAGLYRREDGGHFLFRPAGLTLFAKAVRVLMDRGATIEKAVMLLKRANMEISEDPWRFILWDPHRNAMILKNGVLIKNLLLAEVNQKPDPHSFDVKGEYKTALGEAKTAYAKA